jgi:hypothetical protein
MHAVYWHINELEAVTDGSKGKHMLKLQNIPRHSLNNGMSSSPWVIHSHSIVFIATHYPYSIQKGTTTTKHNMRI